MEHTYKYNSKYSTLTPEERRKKKNENYRIWFNSLNEERKRKYMDMKKQYSRKCLNNYHIGCCEICKKEYANIYNHYKTKIHNAKLQRSN